MARLGAGGAGGAGEAGEAGGAGEDGRQNFYNPLPYCIRHTERVTERSRGKSRCCLLPIAYCLLPIACSLTNDK
ncbi:hypothetical protein MC7420_3804 [Coleofasciculus chthonoplastes PCC 7420]|uniref:Uncharacterized protein n=1 Tax=Coleofasciculus chthonoplastes PCC 7420 TaxID=118168 RepID=B4VUJ5_9CYAN|nr:hypothetical protein [Coleofasciculus chthonoplastes]EDX74280.1 hypothetical protein MC7420_3804 [Coleofasciculus chthonoplastes PCC 7420]